MNTTTLKALFDCISNGTTVSAAACWGCNCACLHLCAGLALDENRWPDMTLWLHRLLHCLILELSEAHSQSCPPAQDRQNEAKGKHEYSYIRKDGRGYPVSTR